MIDDLVSAGVGVLTGSLPLPGNVPEGARVIWYMGGVQRLEPVVHVATWKSPDLFDMVSPIGKWTDCDDLTLALALKHGMLIEFTNARPPKPPVSNGLWAKIMRWLRWDVPS